MSNDSRRFNRHQRNVLKRVSFGRCEQCGASLADGMHADHIVPFSKGGETTLDNGQALCPDCNLSKGDKLMIKPASTVAHIAGREWQQRAIDEVARRIAAGMQQHTVVAFPGAGKTRYSVGLAKLLINAGIVDFVVSVSPKNVIKIGWMESMQLADIALADVTAADLEDPDTHLGVGIATTYQSLVRSADELRALCSRFNVLVFLDEVHWSSEGREKQFGQSVKNAFGNARQVVALSGTPFRTDRMPIPFVDYDQFGEVEPAYSADYKDCLSGDNGTPWCRRVSFRPVDGRQKWTDERGDWDGKLSVETESIMGADGRVITANPHASRYMRAALSTDNSFGEYLIGKAHRRLLAVRKHHPKAGGLVVCQNRAEAHKIRQIVKRVTGENPVLALGDDAKASSKIKQFKNSDAMWIVAVRLISEGTDIPRLRVMAYLSNHIQQLSFIQVVGRIIRWMDDKDIRDSQTAYCFMPDYGPLTLLARDIEEMMPPPTEEESAEADTVEPVEAEYAGSNAEPIFEVRDAEDVEETGSILGGKETDSILTGAADRAMEDERVAAFAESDVQGVIAMMTDPVAMAATMKAADDDAVELLRAVMRAMQS